MSLDVAKNVERLKEIKNLCFDWNGYGANAFSDNLIDKCEKIINRLVVQPSIHPTGRNSIQFEYRLDDGSYLEFEIFEDKILCLEVPKRNYSDAITLIITNFDDDAINKIINDFYKKGVCSKYEN